VVHFEVDFEGSWTRWLPWDELSAVPDSVGSWALCRPGRRAGRGSPRACTGQRAGQRAGHQAGMCVCVRGGLRGPKKRVAALFYTFERARRMCAREAAAWYRRARV
jgi:hypothetical protein